LITVAADLNASMPGYVVSQLVTALREENVSIEGAHVLVLGLSYKADVDDDRESPSYVILDLLHRAGAIVAYADPYFAHTKRTRKYNFELHSVPLDAVTWGAFDAIIVATAHREFMDPSLFAYARLVIDCRNLLGELGTRPPECRWVRA
jgi:UDP-N-acetyl-D-glucosamine dehydrogenase